MRTIWMLMAVMLTSTAMFADPPATRPSADPAMSPEAKMAQMLKPVPQAAARPLQPRIDPPAIDRTTGVGGVAPKTPPQALHREGTFLFDRVGRLTRSPDGQQAEFVFESDGKTLQDPPVIILPNLKLMSMEDAVKSTNRDLRFRVTGMLTEYRGRNYLLLEKVLVPPENGSF